MTQYTEQERAKVRRIVADWHAAKGCGQQIIDDCLSGNISAGAYAEDLMVAALRTASQEREPHRDSSYPIGFDLDAGKVALLTATPASASEAVPVAFCDPANPHNYGAFSWPGTGRNVEHNTPLYTHPAPASGEPAYDRDNIASILEHGLRDGVHGGFTEYYVRKQASLLRAADTHVARTMSRAASGEPERCGECRHTTFEHTHDGGYICVHCKTVTDTKQQAGQAVAPTLTQMFTGEAPYAYETMRQDRDDPDLAHAELWHAAPGHPIPEDATPLYLEPQTPDGYVLVPREPTEAMVEAAASFGGKGGYSAARGEDGREIWQEMLAAAPASHGREGT